MRADPAELMHRRQSAENREVPDLDVPGEGAVVGKNHLVPHRAIMRHVDVSEKVSAISNPCARSRSRAAMHRHKFPKGISISHGEMSRLIRVFQILRPLAERREWIKHVRFSKARRPLKTHMMPQTAACAEFHIRPDDTVRPDLAPLGDPRAGVDYCRRVDLCLTHASTTPKSISASETTSLFTMQRPFTFASARLCCVISTSMKSVSPGTTGFRNFTESALIK